MLTSDDVVIDGAVYEIVLTSEGGELERLVITSDTYATLLRTWRDAEQRVGERLDFEGFFSLALRTVIARPKTAAGMPSASDLQ